MGRRQVVRVAKNIDQAHRMHMIEKYKKNLRLKMEYPTYKPKRYNDGCTIFSIDQVNKIRFMFEAGHAKQFELARMFKCSWNAIRRVVRYQTYIIEDLEKSLIEMQLDGEITPDHPRE